MKIQLAGQELKSGEKIIKMKFKRTISKLTTEAKELNDLIIANPKKKQSIINRWQYFKHAKESQIKILKEVKKVIEEMDSLDKINPRFVNKDKLISVIEGVS